MAEPKSNAATPRRSKRKTTDAEPAAVVEQPETASETEAGAVAETDADAGGKGHGDQLKKKELIERVVAVLGGKKKGVKEVVEATLTVLGDALQKGEALNLPPFGRAKVAKSKGEGRTSSLTVKLRGAGEKNAPKTAKEPLADPGEDG